MSSAVQRTAAESTTVEGTTGPPASGQVEVVRRARRAAGTGGVLAFAAWLLQPLAVFLLSGGEDLLTYASLERFAWGGVYAMVAFGAIGTGLLLLVLRLRDASPLVEAERPTAARIGHLLGVVWALTWFGQAATSQALYTSASGDLPGLAVELQTTALAIYGVVQMSLIVLGAVCGATWLVTLGLTGRREGLVGRATAAFCVLCGIGAVTPFAVPFGPPWGVLSTLLAALVLGVVQLVRSRRGA